MYIYTGMKQRKRRGFSKLSSAVLMELLVVWLKDWTYILKKPATLINLIEEMAIKKSECGSFFMLRNS